MTTRLAAQAEEQEAVLAPAQGAPAALRAPRALPVMVGNRLGPALADQAELVESVELVEPGPQSGAGERAAWWRVT